MFLDTKVITKYHTKKENVFTVHNNIIIFQ